MDVAAVAGDDVGVQAGGGLGGQRRPGSCGRALRGDAGAAPRGVQFLAGEGLVVGFPLGDGGQARSDSQRPPCGCGHPGRDAEALGGGRFDDLGVDVRVDGDGELR